MSVPRLPRQQPWLLCTAPRMVKNLWLFYAGNFRLRSGNVTSFTIPLWLMLLCSILMALGTSIGGYRIIKTVGMDMVKLETYQGFAADFTGAFSLLISSLMAAGQHNPHQNDSYYGGWCCQKAVLRQLEYCERNVCSLDFNFPGCGLVGYLMAHLFIKIF